MEIQTNRSSQKRGKITAFDNIQKTTYRQRKLSVTEVLLPLPDSQSLQSPLPSNKVRWNFLNNMLHITKTPKKVEQRERVTQLMHIPAQNQH